MSHPDSKTLSPQSHSVDGLPDHRVSESFVGAEEHHDPVHTQLHSRGKHMSAGICIVNPVCIFLTANACTTASRNHPSF